MKLSEYTSKVKDLFGKTVAIVYIFEGDTAPGYKHYECWKSDVISSWMLAVEELKGFPLILDAQTFVQKAMNMTLPYIDYVINLNNGTTQISTLGLVPSVCSYLDIPCIPNNTVATVAGENKLISNLIARSNGLNVPIDLPKDTPNGITRPIGLGSSLGVKRGIDNKYLNAEYIYQEFISGIDMTTPIMYNPLTGEPEVLPAIAYIPDDYQPTWFLGEEQKAKHKGYMKMPIRIDNETKHKYILLMKTMSMKCYCRIDARVKCNTAKDIKLLKASNVAFNQIYFLEINPLPTIKDNINFHTSIQSLDDNDTFYEIYKTYCCCLENPTPTGFILSCSMMAYL